jgi:hypothetical protein
MHHKLTFHGRYCEEQAPEMTCVYSIIECTTASVISCLE